MQIQLFDYISVEISTNESSAKMFYIILSLESAAVNILHLVIYATESVK